MRKILMFLFVIIIGFGGFAAWWMLYWVNPQEIVSRAFENLAATKSVKTARVSVYWDARHASGQGYVFQKWLSYAGSLDVADPTAPKAQGVIGISSDPAGEDFQTADAILLGDRAYIRLRDDASEEIRTWFRDAERAKAIRGVPVEEEEDEAASWYAFSLAPLLKKGGLDGWLASGSGADVREALTAAGIGTWAIAGPSKMSRIDDRQTLTVTLRPSADAVNAGLIGVIHAWRKRSPSGVEFDWASRSSIAAANGEWSAIIDVSSRTVREIQGTWPLLSEEGKIVGHATAAFVFDGVGASVKVAEPTPYVDLTSAIVERGPSTFTPSSARATSTSEGAAEEADMAE